MAFNRFQRIAPMDDREFAESNDVCALLYAKIDEVHDSGNHEQELQINQRLYELMFERYVRVSQDSKELVRFQLDYLALSSQKLMLQLNHWEEAT